MPGYNREVGTEASVTLPVAHTSLPPPDNQWASSQKNIIVGIGVSSVKRRIMLKRIMWS